MTIPTAQLNRVYAAIEDESPIDNQINPATGLVYTLAEWSRKWLKDTVVKKVSRYETKVARIAVAVADDPNLVIVS